MKCPTCGAGHVSTHPDGEKRCRRCYATWRPVTKPVAEKGQRNKE